MAKFAGPIVEFVETDHELLVSLATTQTDLARRLRTLHAQPPVVLLNAWDAGSARAIEAVGAVAIATT